MKMFKAEVLVNLKKGVLDPQGSAVERACKVHGHQEISDVRVGKIISFLIDCKSLSEAEAKAKELADQLLANPVMEDYSVHVEEV